MKDVSVVYFSGYGHTQKQAEAIFKGVSSVPGEHSLIKINEQGELTQDLWDKLDASKAIIFGSPTYMGSAAWQFKKFADASSKAWFTEKWKNKIAGGFTNSATINGDKLSTMQWLCTLAMQHGMLWIGTGMLPSNKLNADRNDLNWLGCSYGAIAQSPSDSTPDQGPHPGDLLTSVSYGKRIAELASKIKL